MPRVMVVSEHGGREPDVLFDEQVSSVHLDSEHSAWQFVERLGWAISDAEDGEADALPAARRSARSRERANHPRRRRGASAPSVRAAMSALALTSPGS